MQFPAPPTTVPHFSFSHSQPVAGPYPPGGMSPTVAALFHASSAGSSPSSMAHGQPSPPSYSAYAPYTQRSGPATPPHLRYAQPPPPVQERAEAREEEEDGADVRPGRPLLSRWSAASLPAPPPFASLLTSEIGSFPRASAALFSGGRAIAANGMFVCYSVANGHIRVIAAASGKTALLKGHSGVVQDMELSRATHDGDWLLASVSTGGEAFVWRLQLRGDELSTGVKVSWKSAPDIQDAHYRRVMWWSAGDMRALPGLVLVAADSVDGVRQLRGDAQTPPLTPINQAPSFVRLFFGSGVTDAALSAEGRKLAVGLSNGTIEVVSTDSSDRERGGVESSIPPHMPSGVSRVFFLSSWSPRQGHLPTPVLLACYVRAGSSSFALVHALTHRVLSTLTLSHPAQLITAAEVDPTSSFLLLAHSAPERGEHGLLAVHIRKGLDWRLEAARFDYVTPITTSSAVVSFCLTNGGPDASAVEWDESTADAVQLYCCCTKPIVQFLMRADAVMRRVDDDELIEEKYPEPAPPPPATTTPKQDAAHAPHATAPGLLLTPQAIRAASASSSPSSSPASLPTGSTTAGQRLSITLTAAQASSTAVSLGSTSIKVLQRPPAINSSVLSTSTGSPSSSPTTSHLTAATLVSPSRASPEVPETPASSPAAEGLHALPHLSQQAGLLTFPSLSADAPLSNPTLSSWKNAHGGVSTPPATPPSERKSQPSSAPRKEKELRAAAASEDAEEPSAASEEARGAGGGGKERRRETQEANLIARLDKLFARHLSKLHAVVHAQVERTLTSSREQMERDRTERAAVEKQRTEGLLKAVTQSMQQGAGATAGQHNPPQLEAAVERALARAMSQVVPQLQAAVSSAVAASSSALASSSSGSAPVDADLLAASVVQSLRAPLHEAFKATFSSVLLPGFEASTRVMFKQIENVYARMSQSNEDMLRERVEELLHDRLAAQEAARDDDLKEILTALTTLISTSAALQRTVVAMQQQHEQQQHAIAELKATLLQQRAVDGAASSTSVPPAAAVASQPPAAASGVDWKHDLGMLLHQRQYEAAFTRALSLGKVPPVTWLCSQLDPIPLLHPANPAQRLSPAVVLSLIQQLGFSLKDEADVKLAWIRESLMVLDKADAIIRPHVPDVLRGVLARLEEQLNGPWKDAAHKQLGSQARTVQHLIHATLEQM